MSRGVSKAELRRFVVPVGEAQDFYAPGDVAQIIENMVESADGGALRSTRRAPQ